MVILLVADVIDRRAYMRMRNGKCTKPLLPRKTAANPSLLVDVISRARFYSSDQVRRRFVGLQSQENVRVIWHAVNRDQFLFTLRHDSSNVFLQFLLAIGANNAGAPGDRENNVEIDLRIGVSHCANYMSLLTELALRRPTRTINMARLRRSPGIESSRIFIG